MGSFVKARGKNIMNSEKVLSALKTIYGDSEGIRVYMTVMPGIMADFNKMLDKAKTGEEVREEYILEDRKARIILHGHKDKTGILIESEVV